MHDLRAIISADELAKDVAGVEILLERHHELKGEIDATADSFKATIEAGTNLVSSEHYAVKDAKEKLQESTVERNNLLELWKERRIMYE